MFALIDSVREALFEPDRLAAGIALIAHIILVLVAAHLAIRLLNTAIGKVFEREAEAGGPFLMEEARAKTLASLLKSVVRYSVDVVAVMAILDRLGVPTGTLLAGVGVISLAIGFGAQSLVRDFFSGFFILFENQFSVGDYIETAGVAGIVEEMGFRVTRIKDFGGENHVIPNGAIDKVTNHSRGDMRVLFTVDTAYEEDTEHAIAVIQEALDVYREGHEDIVDGPKVMGVNELGDSGVTLTIWAKAKNMTQWAITRELRLVVKQAMDRAGIEIPYPRSVMVPPTTTKIGRPIQYQLVTAPAAAELPAPDQAAARAADTGESSVDATASGEHRASAPATLLPENDESTADEQDTKHRQVE